MAELLHSKELTSSVATDLGITRAADAISLYREQKALDNELKGLVPKGCFAAVSGLWSRNDEGAGSGSNGRSHVRSSALLLGMTNEGLQVINKVVVLPSAGDQVVSYIAAGKPNIINLWQASGTTSPNDIRKFVREANQDKGFIPLS